MNKLEFKTAFKYPFYRLKGLLNVLWALIPIVGWLALAGYTVRIIKEFVDAKFEELPKMEFGEDFKLGLFIILKAIPFILVYLAALVIVGYISEILVGILNFLVGILVVPIVSINFFYKQTVASFFEFKLVKVVFENFTDYLMVIVKSLGLAIVFIVMFLILVGIPAHAFTKNIFLADFYGRLVKRGGNSLGNSSGDEKETEVPLNLGDFS